MAICLHRPRTEHTEYDLMQTTSSELLDRPCLHELWRVQPHLQHVIQLWGTQSFNEVAHRFYTHGRPSQSAIKVMTQKTAKILGECYAQAMQQRLSSNPHVLSAQHHGIECYPELVQSVHLFALHDLCKYHSQHATPASSAVMTQEQQQADALTIIPILSCSSVALQNATYPRGLMLSRWNSDRTHRIRLPLWSSAYQNTLVMRTPALTPQHTSTARQNWKKQMLSLQEQRSIDAIIEQHIDRDDVYQLSDFCAQVTRINMTLYQERFADTPDVRVIYLELEDIARELITQDVQNPSSLLYRLLFNAEARSRITQRLAGARACWHANLLDGSSANNNALSQQQSYGTVFFWGLDAQGKRIPLRYVNTHGQQQSLVGKSITVPLEPDAIVESLATKRIFPALFCSYISLVAEHHVRCYGGIFFSDYLPRMLNAVDSVFHELDGESQSIPSYNPLCALPQTVQIIDDYGMRPAGGIELFGIGGLHQEDLVRIGKLHLHDVLSLSLREWIAEYAPQALLNPNTRNELQSLTQQWNGVVHSFT